MNKRNILAVFMNLFFLALLTLACTMPVKVIPSSTETPTVDTQLTLIAVRTQAVSTAIAQMNANASLTPPAPTQPAATETRPAPTDTPQPTLTSFPTDTQAPSLTATVLLTSTKLPTLTKTTGPYACSLVSQSPVNGKAFGQREDFDGKWTVKNTGTKIWTKSNSFITFVRGERFQIKGDTFAISSQVKPGEKIDLIVDMLSPVDPGTYNAIWALTSDGYTVCTLYLNIVVK
jgi:hypothetical protein